MPRLAPALGCGLRGCGRTQGPLRTSSRRNEPARLERRGGLRAEFEQRLAEETRKAFEAGRERGRQEGRQAEREAQAAARDSSA